MPRTNEQLSDLISAKFYRSFVQSSDNSVKPTFFYHIEKSGGMSLYYAILFSARGINKILPIDKNIQVYKCDTEEDRNKLLQLSLPDNTFIMSHLAYGNHEHFFDNANLATMLREPQKRLLSYYTYNCMRAQKQPNIEEFRKFYQQEDMVNMMSKKLAHQVVDLSSEGAAKKVFQHLQDNFTYFGFIEHLDLFINHYLNSYQLPNVFMEPMNVTLPQYKLDAKECIDEINALNSIDAELYELVKGSPRLPENLQGNTINNFSVLLCEKEKELRSMCTSLVVETQELFNSLNNYYKQHGDKKISIADIVR